jgi:uncharacterized protein (TIGR03086 family)
MDAFNEAVSFTAGVVKGVPAGQRDALTRSHPSPFGDMPGDLLASFTTLDIAVHGWDLAAATGQASELGDALAQHLLGFAHQTLPDAASRGDRIAPPVPVDDDASRTARLVGYLGRRP